MAITEDYYTQVKNVKEIFESIKNAQAPEKFTTKFLYDLGFTSINDRPFIKVLKTLGFIDESGTPKQRYFDFLDDERSSAILAQGIREAYGDLFSVNQKAYELDNAAVKGKLKSLLQGKKSEAVLTKMATTFTTLCSLAEFKQIPQKMEKKDEEEHVVPKIIKNENVERAEKTESKRAEGDISLKYSINIELPATRDKLIYDAIFKSLKEHLL